MPSHLVWIMAIAGGATVAKLQKLFFPHLFLVIVSLAHLENKLGMAFQDLSNLVCPRVSDIH